MIENKIHLKKLLLILSIITMLIQITGCGSTSRADRDEKRRNMKAYLENKYGEEFVVGPLSVVWDVKYGEQGYKAIAYPKSNEELKFEIWSSFFEKYSLILRSYQAEKAISETLKEIYGEDLPVIASVSASDEVPAKLGFYEAITEYGENVSLKVGYSVFIAAELDKEKEAEKAYKVFKKYILDNKIAPYSFNITYFKNQYKEEIVERTEKVKKGSRNAINFTELYEEGKLINIFHLSTLQTPDVNSLEDVMSCFDY